MIINGKDVEVNFKQAEIIQNKVNKVEQLPETTKVEVNKSDLKLINQFAENNYGFDGYGMNNNTLNTGKNSKFNRKEYYTTFQEMSETNFIHRGLQIIADDCSQRNEEGHTIKVYSDDDEIKETLETLFNERLNLDKELWSIIYETCKLGDNFYEIIPDSYQNPSMIARIRYLEPERVNRIEKNGKLAFYTYIADATDPEEFAFRTQNDNKDENKVIYKLEPWQIVHFRIPNKKFNPYGGSLLDSGVGTFRKLQLLEDGMVIYRLARVPERRVFSIDVGNLPQSEAMRQMKLIKDNYRTAQIMDENGNINRTASALSLTQDIFIPKREGSGTDITTLPAGQALSNIDDIKYFKDQILWTMNIPPEYLGFTSDQSGGSQGRGSLAMQDIKFSRFAERIQFNIEEGLAKIAAIELFFKHKKKSELRNFRVELTPPSNIKELMQIEYANNKMQLMQSMNGVGMFPKKFILKYVMKLSKKEIDNLMFFKELETQAGQIQDTSMMGGMATIGGDTGVMDTGNTLPPDNSATQPTSSVITTEKMVNVFGKDLLIEHKEDFAKLMKALDEYNSNKEKTISEEKELEKNEKIFEEIFKEDFNKNKTGERNLNLIFENELGGLNFDSNEFRVFDPPKKRTGPKGKKPQFLYEEKIHFFY